MGLINQIGMFGWPLVLITVATVGVFVKHAVVLFGNGAQANTEISCVKFFGLLGLSLGIFSTVLGIYQGMQIFSMISSDQAATGFSRALLALLFGLFIFILASIFDFILRVRLQKLQSGSK